MIAEVLARCAEPIDIFPRNADGSGGYCGDDAEGEMEHLGRVSGVVDGVVRDNDKGGGKWTILIYLYFR